MLASSTPTVQHWPCACQGPATSNAASTSTVRRPVFASKAHARVNRRELALVPAASRARIPEAAAMLAAAMPPAVPRMPATPTPPVPPLPARRVALSSIRPNSKALELQERRVVPVGAANWDRSPIGAAKSTCTPLAAGGRPTSTACRVATKRRSPTAGNFGRSRSLTSRSRSVRNSSRSIGGTAPTSNINRARLNTFAAPPLDSAALRWTLSIGTGAVSVA